MANRSAPRSVYVAAGGNVNAYLVHVHFLALSPGGEPFEITRHQWPRFIG